MAKSKPAAHRRRYFKEVRFRQIRALVELSRRKSFTATANELGLSVPTVWQQVRALEDEFGAPLVFTSGQRVELTDDGRTFVELAAPLVESFDSLAAAFADRRGTTPRSLIVAAPAPLLARELREPIRRYRQRLPEVKLTLIDRPSGLARELLEQGRADVAVIGVPGEHASLPQFQTYRLARFNFRLICRVDHSLATDNRITLKKLAKQPLVLAVEESSSRKHVEKVFAKGGLADQINVTMTAESLGLVMTYVSMGFGVSVVTTNPNLEPPPPQPGECEIMFRDLTRLFGTEEIILLERKGHHELPHVQTFRQLVCESMKQDP